MSTISTLLVTLLMVSGLFLIGLILLQRGRGGGLASGLGGLGGHSVFGNNPSDVFTRITIGVASIWILLAVGSVVALRYSTSGLRNDDQIFRKDISAKIEIENPADEAFECPNRPVGRKSLSC